MIGIAKGPHHGREGREIFHMPDGREISFPINHPVLFYLQRLRDEAGKRLGAGRYIVPPSAMQRPQSFSGGDATINQQITLNAPSSNPAALARATGDEVGRATARVSRDRFIPPGVEAPA